MLFPWLRSPLVLGSAGSRRVTGAIANAVPSRCVRQVLEWVGLRLSDGTRDLPRAIAATLSPRRRREGKRRGRVPGVAAGVLKRARAPARPRRLAWMPGAELGRAFDRRRRGGARVRERFPRVASLRSAAGLRARLDALGIDLPCDEAIECGPAAPLARPLALGSGPHGDLVAGNRFVVQPMEGWDGTPDGLPS